MTLENNLDSFIDKAAKTLNLKGQNLFEVKDVLTTYADAFGTNGKYTNVTDDGAIIEILADETKNNKPTYYRCKTAGSTTTWNLVGTETSSGIKTIPVATETSVGGFKLDGTANTLAKTNVKLENETATIDLKSTLGDLGSLNLTGTFDSTYKQA